MDESPFFLSGAPLKVMVKTVALWSIRFKRIYEMYSKKSIAIVLPFIEGCDLSVKKLLISPVEKAQCVDVHS